MGALFVYSLYSGIFLFAGWAAYRLLLASRRYGTMNRLTLIGIYISALMAMPLMDLAGSWHTASAAAAMADVGPLTAVALSPSESATDSRIVAWMLWIYATGLAAMTLHMAAGLLRVRILISRGSAERHDGYRLVRLKGCRSPFSFGKTIVVAPEEKDLDIIITHELSHIRHRDWIDLLIAQGVCLLMWYNPASWLMRRELRDIHEYVADASVVSGGIDAVSYQKILLKKAIGTRLQPFTNSLNQSNIYKRITMMYKKTPSGASRLRVLGLIPALLCAAALCGSSPVVSAFNLVATTSLDDAAKSDAKVKQISPAVQKQSISKLPMFPGGEAALLKYLQTNVVYPEAAAAAGEQGTVIVTFTVIENGSITDVAVNKGVSPALDKEAMRVVASMSPWTPGTDENGRTVSCVYTLPVNFRLQNDPRPVSVKTQTANATESAADPVVNRNEPMAYNLNVTDTQAPITPEDGPVKYPRFPGGESELFRYVATNIAYPQEATAAGEQGTVVVAFKINADGSVSDPSVTRSVSESLDKEAIRVISTLPRWTPGTNENGEPTTFEYHLPVRFKLSAK